jgi:hypothetical protein
VAPRAPREKLVTLLFGAKPRWPYYFIKLLPWFEPRPESGRADILISQASSDALATKEERTAFLTRLRQDGSAGDILQVIADGKGPSIARILGILVAGEKAKDEDVSTLCKLYRNTVAEGEKNAALLAILTKRDAKDPFFATKKMWLSVSQVPSVRVEVGSVPSPEAAKCVLDGFMTSNADALFASVLLSAFRETAMQFPEAQAYVLERLQATPPPLKEKEFHLLSLLAETKSEQATQLLKKLASHDTVDANARMALAVLAEQDTSDSIAAVLDVLSKPGLDLSDFLPTIETLSSSSNQDNANRINQFLSSLLLSNPNTQVRLRVVLHAITNRPETVAQEALNAARDKETDTKVRTAIEEALRQLKSKRPPNDMSRQ